MRTINRDLYRTKTIPTTRSLLGLTMLPFVRNVRRWWYRRAEQHYLICADVEAEREREAQMNLAYYQKRAALARAAQYD